MKSLGTRLGRLFTGTFMIDGILTTFLFCLVTILARSTIATDSVVDGPTKFLNVPDPISGVELNQPVVYLEKVLPEEAPLVGSRTPAHPDSGSSTGTVPPMSNNEATTPEFASCNFKLEFVFLLDTSWSYLSRYPYMARHIEGVFDFIMKVFPGSRIGVATFIDSPVCAGISDYCAKMHVQLTKPAATDLRSLIQLIDTLEIGNGRDMPENYFGSILRTMHSSLTGWTSPSIDIDPIDGRRPLRIIFAVTDAISHVSPKKQICSLTGEVFEPFPLDPHESWLRDDIDQDCMHVEFPTIEHLPVYVARSHVHPVLYYTNTAASREMGRPVTAMHGMSVAFGAPYNVTPESHPEILGNPNSWTLLEDTHRYIFGQYYNFFPLIKTGWDDFLGLEDDVVSLVSTVASNACKYFLATTTAPTTEAIFFPSNTGVNISLTTQPETTTDTTDTADVEEARLLSGASIAAGAAVVGAAAMYLANRVIQLSRGPESQAFLEDAELQDVAVDREVHTEVEDFFC